MFKEIKQLTGQSVIYGLSHISGRLMTFMLLPVFTHYLNPEQFGVYNLYYVAVGLMMEVVLLGQNVTLLNFYDPDESKEKLQRLFSTIFWTVLFSSVTVGVIFWIGDVYWVQFIFKSPQPYPGWSLYTLKLSVLLLIIDAIRLLPLVILRREGKATQFALINLAGIVVQTTLTIIFLIHLKRGIPGIFEANVIAATLILILTLPTIATHLRPRFDLYLFQKCLSFGLPLLPNALFVFAVELADRKILEILRGPAEVGLYAAGCKLGMFMAVMTMAVRFAWQPFFLSKRNHPDAKQIFARVLTYGLAISGWIFLMLTSFVEPLVKTTIAGKGPLISPEYWSGLGVFPLILLAHLFMGIYMILSVGIYLKDKTKLFPIITGIALIVNIVGNYLLIPQYGMYGAAWMRVLSYLIMAVLLYRFANRVYPIPYEWKRVIHIVVAAALLYGIGALGRQFGIYWSGYVLAVMFPLLLLFTGLATNTEMKRFQLLLRGKF